MKAFHLNIDLRLFPALQSTFHCTSQRCLSSHLVRLEAMPFQKATMTAQMSNRGKREACAIAN